MSKNLSEDGPGKRASANEFGTRQLFRRPANPGRKAVLFIKLFGDNAIVVTGDERFVFAASLDMDLLSLVAVEAFVSTVSSSGGVSVSIYNLTQTQDMLTAAVTIDSGEFTSCTAAVPVNINDLTNTVEHCDLISCNVDGAGVDAMGLGVMLTFGLQPLP